MSCFFDRILIHIHCIFQISLRTIHISKIIVSLHEGWVFLNSTNVVILSKLKHSFLSFSFPVITPSKCVK